MSIVTEDKKRIVLWAEEGEAYASEIKLLERALKNIDISKIKVYSFIADKGFDSIKIMEDIAKSGVELAIRVKETFRINVKHPLRKKSKEGWNKFGRYRYLIESLFGNIKQKLGGVSIKLCKF
ncbi:transposase [Hydrogenothermus marinus]|uniref:transposase n=1 Tax=Hydrogenothermus marinus TaxID=133270 RepID=UPI000EF9F011